MGTKQEISAKQIGNNLIVIIDGKKYTKVCKDKKEIDPIKNKILLYNKRNTVALKEEILSIVDKVTQKKEEQKTKEKGLKKSIKKVLKVDKKVISKKKIAVKKTIDKVKAAADKLGYDLKKRKDVSGLLVVTRDGNLAMKGFEQVPMPSLLIDKINAFLDAKQGIEPLLNFWSLCLLNPNPIARTKLFDYVTRQKLIITPSGYFVTYRMVKRTSTMGEFVDAHTGKFKHILGKVSKMDRSLCDEDGGNDCSKGLHTGTPKFIGIITKTELDIQEGKGSVGDNYGVKTVVTKAQVGDSYGTGYDRPTEEKTQKFDNTFGNQAIICLVNPAHVVSVPDSDTRKMRSCEFYFAKLTTPEEVIELNENNYLIYDFDYQKEELDQLQELLKTKEVKAFVGAKSDNKKYKQLELDLQEVQKDLKLSTDVINTALSPAQLKSIINQRQVILTKKK